jgi:predicted nucleic acid-binding protein
VALVLDTGPLYAALDRDDAAHSACRRLLETAHEPLVVPSPVLVEVDYWIHERLHPGVLVALLDDIADGGYRVEDLKAEDADSDIGFVDASVVAIVERLNEPKVATLDRRHFGLIRPRHVNALRLLPE